MFWTGLLWRSLIPVGINNNRSKLFKNSLSCNNILYKYYIMKYREFSYNKQKRTYERPQKCYSIKFWNNRLYRSILKTNRTNIGTNHLQQCTSHIVSLIPPPVQGVSGLSGRPGQVGTLDQSIGPGPDHTSTFYDCIVSEYEFYVVKLIIHTHHLL